MAEERLLSPAFALTNAANLTFFTGVTTFFVLPVHLEALGASRAEIGHVMGAFGLTSVVAIPLTGLLIDRYGRRPFMLAGAVLWGLTALGFTQVGGLGPALFLLRMCQGVAFSLAFVSTSAMVADLAPVGSLGRAISIFGTTTLVTHALGPSVGEMVLRGPGFHTLCLISAGSALSALAVFGLMREPTRPEGMPESRSGTRLLALATRAGARGALLAGTTSALAFGSAMNFMPIFVRSRGLPSFSPFFVGYVVSAILVRVVAGGLGDRLGYRRVGAVSLAAFSLVVACFAMVRQTGALVTLALAFGVAHGWAYPSLNALFLDGVSPHARGRAMSLYNLSFNAGVTLAAFTGGEIAERFGYSAMWVVMAALPAIGVVGLMADRRQQC